MGQLLTLFSHLQFSASSTTILDEEPIVNRGLAAALLLCQNKGVGSGREPGQGGFYSREGLDRCPWVLHGLGFPLLPLPSVSVL